MNNYLSDVPVSSPGEHSLAKLGSAAAMFYVYRLIDPRDSACFYIGKGKGRRAWYHEECAKRGEITNLPKHERIRTILNHGKTVKVEIVARFDEERLAYAHEYDLIQSTEGLTNIAPGIGPVPSREEVLEARAFAAVNGLKSKRAAQHERFVRGLPENLQKVASGWLAGLTVKEEVETIIPWLPVTKERMPGVKGRRRYKRSTPCLKTQIDLPPRL